MALDITDSMGTPLMQIMPVNEPFLKSVKGTHPLKIEIELPLLIPGKYYVDLWVGCHYSETYNHVRQALSFYVAESPMPNRTFPHSRDHGSLIAKAELK